MGFGRKASEEKDEGFPAKYDGFCFFCAAEIYEGETIAWSKEDNAFVHAEHLR